MSLFAIFNFCSPFDIEKMKEYKKCADLLILKGIIKGSGYNFLFKTLYVTPVTYNVPTQRVTR